MNNRLPKWRVIRTCDSYEGKAVSRVMFYNDLKEATLDTMAWLDVPNDVAHPNLSYSIHTNDDLNVAIERLCESGFPLLEDGISRIKRDSYDERNGGYNLRMCIGSVISDCGTYGLYKGIYPAGDRFEESPRMIVTSNIEDVIKSCNEGKAVVIDFLNGKVYSNMESI